MANSHPPSLDDLDLDLDIDLTRDDIFPPADADADAATILNPKSLNVSKSSQIDPNPNGFDQSGSQLIETRVFKSSPELVQTRMDSVNSEGDEKRKLRRMRNRENSQIYRQRKKDYVEELEEKVRIMASTIQHLKLENAALKSQMGSTGVPSQMLLPPPPGMYPWMPYMVKQQVPLVPIPRLKPQGMAPAPKRSKKVENTETEMKTKKVASVTYLGLLFFMLLYGGLRSGYNERQHGRVFTVDGRINDHYRTPADGDKDKAKSTIQQWFLEGVAGPMLSSGMCTEVFQFAVSSSPGVIVPAAAVSNVSMEQKKNATHTNKRRNRRILDGLSVPVTGVSHDDISEEHEGRSGKKDDLAGNSSRSSMVVSVLVDPIEAGDGMIGQKSTSRIYVVVLIDSVKYVTYSCMLSFKGTVPLVL
ncbi:bZIP transcription factor 17-like [Solanum stenotomum]|uniref:bZIP transcription factor 17-like n=1 Tax=Solanum stenotomum TaxID=172797 RepID=UPI0020D10157|nr:bZIP transcription factor 17-like [Solanum stenotomum]